MLARMTATMTRPKSPSHGRPARRPTGHATHDPHIGERRSPFLVGFIVLEASVALFVAATFADALPRDAQVHTPNAAALIGPRSTPPPTSR